MPETTTRRQSVNFLGFLRGQLSGLQGIPTLVYELIQNADDVKDERGSPGASKIIFDVCDDALYVYNDGVFREIDFERMEKVSWGNKREEEGTTGAFGIGFISVYQITDSPEIFSSGKHWQFVPGGIEEERIRETRMETRETKFRLPWAFTASEVRKELGFPPIKHESLDIFTVQIKHAIGEAALFLKQVRILEIKRNNKMIRKIETIRENGRLLIADGNDTVTWQIFEGRFDGAASEMRRKYGEIIERKRQSIVKLAVPDNPNERGLLYAFLPSEMATGLPFHINADFYPNQDRKRIIFEGGYKAEWNNHAINCAAEILAKNCGELLGIFENKDFWRFAERVKQGSINNGISNTFENFWNFIKPVISNNKSVLTGAGTIVQPSDAIFLDSKEMVDAEQIFVNLSINTVHQDIRGQQNILLETGVRNLKFFDIHQAFFKHRLTERVDLPSMPRGLRSLKGWMIFWEALENLWSRTPYNEREHSVDLLAKLSIEFGSDDALWPPDDLYIADPMDQEFFSKISKTIWFAEKSEKLSLPSELIKEFTVDDGLDLLKEAQNELHELWQEGVFSPNEMLEWFDRNRQEFLNNQRRNIARSLAIWPDAEGNLKPLTELYLAGDFEDPLRLAKLVDLEALGGGRELFERYLYVGKLDFITYIKDWVPTVISKPELKRGDKFKLIRIIAENLGKYRENQEIRAVLANLPIVWCGEDKFLPAGIVWFDTVNVREVMGQKVNLAKLPTEKSETIRELYLWMGVSPEPKPRDIISRIRTIVASPPNPESVKLVGRLIEFIASKWVTWEEDEQEVFAELKNFNWLPGTRRKTTWCGVHEVYSVYSRFLFESQGNFLDLEFRVQQKANDLFKFLEIESEPEPVLVVNHILYSSQKGEPISSEIYGFLNRYIEDEAIYRLIGQKSLFFNSPDGEGAYFYPGQVFWEQHPFGKRRFRLSADYGRFKTLFDRIGVKDQPTVEDAISVLLEISEEYGGSNHPLEKGNEDRDIVIMCWKLISEALENQKIKDKDVKTKLGKAKTILDVRDILTKPELMFFEDRPGWGEKFQIVKNNLTPRIEGAWMGMEAAGVRPLSSVITTEMVVCEDSFNNERFIEYINERQGLFLRIVEGHRIKGERSLTLKDLGQLTYFQAREINIVRIFQGFGRQEKSELESVDAILYDKSLYFVKPNGAYPWKGISRELSYVINPTGELTSLGIELKEILSQPISDAMSSLDEYGYPVVTIVEPIISEGQTLEPDEDLEPIRVSVEAPDAGSAGSRSLDGQPGENGSYESTNVGGTTTLGGRVGKRIKRKNSRLISYVNQEDELSTRHENPETSAKRTVVGEIGVERVMQFEREQLRNPKDMETIQVHHPGYDIESIDNQGRFRFIEVKALSGVWDSQNPAQLTKTEFETAKKKGEDYWLYVVELASSDDFRIHTIQNPANRVGYYLFDHGWIPKDS